MYQTYTSAHLFDTLVTGLSQVGEGEQAWLVDLWQMRKLAKLSIKDGTNNLSSFLFTSGGGRVPEVGVIV